IKYGRNLETICSGGVVDEEYLATVEGCQTINGDLHIDGWEKPPSHLDNLQTVTRINGSLHIRNTTGLGVFDYLGALKEVTVPKGKNTTAIEIVNNRGLTEIQIPFLERVSSENFMRIVITDNPALGMKESMAQKLYYLADGKHHTRIYYKDKTTFWDDLMDNKLYLVIFIMLCLIMIMILLISTLLIVRTVKRRQVETKEGFPKPPWKLQKQSKDIIVGWVKNGRIPSSDNFLVFERVKSVMNNDVVIMIGNEKHPCCVLPDIPYELKKEHTYKYKGTAHTFKLIKIKQMAPCTHEFSYLVTTTAKGTKKASKKQEKKIKEIVYYRWDNRIMPLEYDEILQLAMMYKPERTICISNRRKEVFSLIHMFHTYCCILKEEITVSDVLQLHTEKCNGSILDRNELVFVMAVIMEWAYQSRSLPDDLKKKHMDWCHSYAIMAKFMRNNPN
ncbi:receptor L domain protein, partial [Ancylostoma caninum]